MYLWTSEAVSSGHPDKVADQIADAVLDGFLAVDPFERVACEVTCCKDLVLVTGEVSSQYPVDIESIVRNTIIDIGYDGEARCYDGSQVPILNKLNRQSHEIAAAVAKDTGEIGAGDQGIMFGYACDETPTYMPLAHHLSFRLINELAADRKRTRPGRPSILSPDAKTQVTIAYDNEGWAQYIDTIVISTQHLKDAFNTLQDLQEYLHCLATSVLRDEPLLRAETKWFLNPAGLWSFGGPAADTGLSGRKIVVDNYGADCPIGGGSFSGKDPTKVDRSGAYAARHIAKNIVAAGLAKKCQVQISYAIGIVDPVSIRVQTVGNVTSDELLTQAVRELVPLSPKAIIDRFDLRRPIYTATASGGHFGRDEFPWEQLDLVSVFQDWVNRL